MEIAGNLSKKSLQNLRESHFSTTVLSMNHLEWLKKITNDSSIHAAALKSGLPPRTFAAQSEKGKFPMETIIKVAEAYNQNPINALVDTGYIDQKYLIQEEPAKADLAAFSEEEILEEVMRRMAGGQSLPLLNKPLNPDDIS